MKVYKYIDPKLCENYIDIHYKEMNPEIEGILEYFDHYNTIIGQNEHGQKVISFHEVFYCEIVDRKCYVYLEKEVYQVNLSIQKLLEMFQPNGFVRIGKSMIVNILKIDCLKTDLNMRVNLRLNNGEVVVLNRGYRKEFYNSLNKFRKEQ